MRPAGHPDHHPHDDTHGGNAIHDNDREPVTVSDLLDAFQRSDDDQTGWAAYKSLRKRAPVDATRSHDRIINAIASQWRADNRRQNLSPEERAEFDRRTT